MCRKVAYEMHFQVKYFQFTRVHLDIDPSCVKGHVSMPSCTRVLLFVLGPKAQMCRDRCNRCQRRTTALSSWCFQSRGKTEIQKHLDLANKSKCTASCNTKEKAKDNLSRCAGQKDEGAHGWGSKSHCRTMSSQCPACHHA